MLHGADHGEGDLAESADAIGGDGAHEGIEPSEKFVGREDVALAGRGPHEAGAEVVDVSESGLQESVLGAAFDARPHRAAFLGRVSEGAGDIDKGHAGIEGREGAREVEGEVEGEVGIVRLVHAKRADTGAEEACVVAGQFVPDRVEREEVGDEKLVQFGMAMAAGAAADGENFVDGGVREALEEDAFAYHAGGSGENDFQGRDAPGMRELRLLVRLRRATEGYKIWGYLFWPLAFRLLDFRPGVGHCGSAGGADVAGDARWRERMGRQRRRQAAGGGENRGEQGGVRAAAQPVSAERVGEENEVLLLKPAGRRRRILAACGEEMWKNGPARQGCGENPAIHICRYTLESGNDATRSRDDRYHRFPLSNCREARRRRHGRRL